MSNARATPAGAPSAGRGRRPAPRADEVPSITSAQEALADDQARRTRRYLVHMGVRLVCFLAAIFLARGILWLQMVLLAAAVVLPYSAVLFANAGRDRVSYDTSPFTAAELGTLPAATTPETPDPVPGDAPPRVVEHQDDADDRAGAQDDDRPDPTKEY